jgi:hypothetical protein
MMHFGSGGLFDYILSEITWVREFGHSYQFVGRNMDYDANKHWVAVRDTYRATNLKRNLVIR